MRGIQRTPRNSFISEITCTDIRNDKGNKQAVEPWVGALKFNKIYTSDRLGHTKSHLQMSKDFGRRVVYLINFIVP